MAITTNDDGSISMRHGNGDVFLTLAQRFGGNPTPHADRIGGAIMMLMWRYELDGVRYATVASAGLERIPFEGVPPLEVMATVLDEQAGAATVAVELVVRRAVEELQAPWQPGRVWMNDQPILRGTRIQALVVGPSGLGPEFDELRGDDGARSGDLHTILMLTPDEARVVATQGLPAIADAQRNQPHLLADVERQRDVVSST